MKNSVYSVYGVYAVAGSRAVGDALAHGDTPEAAVAAVGGGKRARTWLEAEGRPVVGVYKTPQGLVAVIAEPAPTTVLAAFSIAAGRAVMVDDPLWVDDPGDEEQGVQDILDVLAAGSDGEWTVRDLAVQGWPGEKVACASSADRQVVIVRLDRSEVEPSLEEPDGWPSSLLDLETQAGREAFQRYFSDALKGLHGQYPEDPPSFEGFFAGMISGGLFDQSTLDPEMMVVSEQQLPLAREVFERAMTRLWGGCFLASAKKVKHGGGLPAKLFVLGDLRVWVALWDGLPNHKVNADLVSGVEPLDPPELADELTAQEIQGLDSEAGLGKGRFAAYRLLDSGYQIAFRGYSRSHVRGWLGAMMDEGRIPSVPGSPEFIPCDSIPDGFSRMV